MSRRRQVNHRTTNEDGSRSTRSRGGETVLVHTHSLTRALDWFVYPVLLLIVIVFLTVRPISDPDCWFHMALGRYVLEHGVIPRTDVFSHTAAGREWISSGWASSVLLQWIFSHWGPPGLALMMTALLSALYLPLYIFGLKRTGWGEPMLLVLLSSLLAAYLRFNPRPDLWSLLFLPYFLLLVSYLSRQTSRHFRIIGAVAMPLIIALWANFHAGFLAGIITFWISVIAMIVTHEVELTAPRAKILFAAGAALSLAWILNPYGFRFAMLAGKIQAIPGVRTLVFEWMPLIYLPGFNLPWPTYVGFFLLGLFFVVAYRLSRSKKTRWPLFVAAFFLLFALWQRRQGGLYATGIPVLILPFLSNLSEILKRRVVFARSAAMGGPIAICLLQYYGILESGQGLPTFGVNARTLPCIPTEYLAQVPTPPKLFNSYAMGGYLLYHLSPQIPIFIDGRLDVYDPSVWADYLAIEENRMSIDMACVKYGINTFAIETRDAIGEPTHLANRLAADPRWILLFFDDDYMIFARKEMCADSVQSKAFQFANPLAMNKFLTAMRAPETQQRALEELRRAIEVSNGSALAYAMASLAAKQNGEDGAAERYKAAALARDPTCPLLR